MINIVRETCLRENLIEKGDGIVIALSGGPDSVAMLYSLYLLKEELDIKLVAVHLNHLFRGENSDRDEAYVIELCNSLHIDLRTFRTDITQLAKDKSMSFEEAGRYERYRLFNKVMSEFNYDKIAVAQNRNDQAETVLMRMIRGTGITGLKGINYIRDNYIIRPILDVDREIIEEFCEDHNLNPRVDHTNFEDVYFRNKVRLKLLPLLKNEFSGAINDSLIRTSHLASDDDDYLNAEANRSIDELFSLSENEYFIDVDRFNELHISIKRRVIRNLVLLLSGSLNDLSFALISELLVMFSRKTHGSMILWNEIEFKVSYKNIIIKNNKCKKHNWKFSSNVYDRENVDISGEDKSSVYLDFDTIVGEVYLRYRINGDKFSPLGLDGNKKLKNYFIDKKIPKDKRDNIPLLCDNEGILWIAGQTIDNRVKVTNLTKKIIELKVW
ncbi:MAG: tRNA lysidine(34) synthetase TilS [Acidaminobacteraceae bacterium]